MRRRSRRIPRMPIVTMPVQGVLPNKTKSPETRAQRATREPSARNESRRTHGFYLNRLVGSIALGPGIIWKLHASQRGTGLAVSLKSRIGAARWANGLPQAGDHAEVASTLRQELFRPSSLAPVLLVFFNFYDIQGVGLGVQRAGDFYFGPRKFFG
jgi:hypothetical protein